MEKTIGIGDFLRTYANALASFSADKAAEFYQLPFMLYSEKGVQVIEKRKDIASFFEQAMKTYKEDKIASTVPEIILEEELTAQVFLCKVRWTNLDASGKKVSGEPACYLISDHNGDFKISALIM